MCYCQPLRSFAEEKVLADYRELPKVIKCPDLQQYPCNGRSRGECRDKSLMTLTTNSAHIYNEETCRVDI